MALTQFLDTDAAFALNLARLSDQLYDQMQLAMAGDGVTIPARLTGIVQLLHSEGAQSQADIAQRLGLSHQLVAQRLTWLTRHKMIETRPDPDDGRRKLITLTGAGGKQADGLQAFLPKLLKTYERLFAELGLDLHGAVQGAGAALDAEPLQDRIAKEGQER